MRGTRIVVAVALTLAATLAVAAPAAQARSSWFQSIGRSSAAAPCPNASFGTPWQANWDPSEQHWRPSYGQWMNGGRGGWTCDRTITWDPQTRYPSAGCVAYVDGSGTSFVNFGGGWSVGTGPRYTDAACTSLLAWGNPSRTDPIDLFFVYAPAGFDASALCREAFPAETGIVSAAGSAGEYFCRQTVG